MLDLTLVTELSALLGSRWVRYGPRDLLSYAYDATGEKHPPDVVVFPSTTDEVAACVRLARRHGLPVVPRGAGTNLSGGSLPVRGGMVVNLVRMNQILWIDTAGRQAAVQAGVTNGALQEALAPHGFFFAPDPSSMRVSTIGGNIAENAGGLHCAKYGVTTNHVIGATAVTSDGEVIELGGRVEDAPGLDVLGLFTGSEGTLGIVTEAVLRILPLPGETRTMLAVFDDVSDCVAAVAGLVAARVIPAALELMDRGMIGTVRVSSAGAAASYPEDASAVLVIDVDGDPEDLPSELERLESVLRAHRVREIRRAQDEAERDALWLGRRSAYGSLARLSPSVWTMDVTVPRDRLVEMLDRVNALGREYNLPVFTVAHAGDGNLHPTLPFNGHDPAERVRLMKLDAAIQAACAALGGSITGEHGVGVEKLPGMGIMYGPEQLELMQRARRALDPEDRMNPGKAIPARKGAF